MGFRTGSYATVWSVEEKSKTMTRGRISISRKNRDTGEYETDFSGFVAFIGTAAAAKALKLKEKDRIKLGDVDVQNKYDRENNTTYTYFNVFSFEDANAPNNGGDVKNESAGHAIDEGYEQVDEDDLPF